MHISEFEPVFNRLKLTYGEKVFPVEREKLFFKRYMRADASAFLAAIDTVILQMPQPSMIIGMIDQSLASSKPRQPGADGFKEPSYNCEPCKDHGYGWIGDTVTRCVCAFAQTVTDEDIKRHQAGYDKGAVFRKGGAKLIGVTRKLPYDPKARLA